MKLIAYDSVTRALDTWDKARRTVGDTELGHEILNRFLILEPKAKYTFANMKSHGDMLVELFDSLFQLLGPDIEFLEEICHQVGRKHRELGVAKAYFPKMGLALIHGLEVSLGDAFTAEDHDAWREAYKRICDEILRAME